MKRLLLSSLVLIAAGLLTVSASAAARMEIDSVVLLQPDFIMKERVPDVAQFAAYIRAVQQAAVGTVAGKAPSPASGGFLVVAIRPGNESKVWTDFRPPLPPALNERLIKRMHQVNVPGVACGPVIFAVKVRFPGGAFPVEHMPSPNEWRKAANQLGGPVETGELVEYLWKK